jgi:ClpX C4-type zinc finger
LSDASENQRWPTNHDDARCSFCRESPGKVGPLVEGEGPQGSGGVFICEQCAELVLTIIAEEKRRRRTSEAQGETPKVTVKRPMLAHLQELVRQSVVTHNGVLPKESALVWFGYFASLLTWELLSVEDFYTLMKSLPDYPEDAVVQRILGRLRT